MLIDLQSQNLLVSNHLKNFPCTLTYTVFADHNVKIALFLVPLASGQETNRVLVRVFRPTSAKSSAEELSQESKLSW